MLKLIIPSLMFVGGAAAAAVVALQNEGSLRIAGFAIAWWCCCGAVMQIVDYPRKRSVYRRLLPRRDAVVRGRAPADLRSTICGLCILWALRDEPRVTGASLCERVGEREGEEYA